MDKNQDQVFRGGLYAAATVIISVAIAYFGSGILATLWSTSRPVFFLLFFCFYFGILLFWLVCRKPIPLPFRPQHDNRKEYNPVCNGSNNTACSCSGGDCPGPRDQEYPSISK